MNIIHLSFTPVPNATDPVVWLRTIGFFTGIVTQMSKTQNVSSIHCIDFSGTITHEGATYHFFKPVSFQRVLSFSICKFIRKQCPEVVIVHGLHQPGQLLALRLFAHKQTRLFVQHHAERPNRLHKGLLQRLADRFVDGYFFAARELAAPWVSAGQIASMDKVHEVMEVSSPFYAMDKAKARDILHVKGHPVYLWVGRLDPNKDPQTLVRSFARFIKEQPQAFLYVIYKGGNLLAEVQALCQGLEDNMKLVGPVMHTDLLYWYNAADFIVSTSHNEGSGTAVCEAMSCGCIPILSDIPSFRAMSLQGGVGSLFVPGDAEQLFQRLKASTGTQIEEEGQNVIHQFRKNLSFDAIAEKMIFAITPKE